MVSGNRYDEIRRFVLLDIGEAFSSERMLSHLSFRSACLARLGESDEARGLKAIEGALAFRFGMSVQRLLQGDGKATLVSLLKAASLSGPDAAAYNDKLRCIRESPISDDLKSCRDEFMAHTVVGSVRRASDISTHTVGDLLFEMAKFIEELHETVTGQWINAHHCFDQFDKVAEKTWDLLLTRLVDPAGQMSLSDLKLN